MRVVYEIAGKYEEPAPCESVVHARIDPAVTFRKSRLYEVGFDGDTGAADGFLRHSLFDPIGQVLSVDAPLWPEAVLVLEVGMKPGALDLEKEAILSVHRRWPEAGFTLSSLRLSHRFSVFGPVTEAISRRLVRDLVNPAIHTHRVHHP